MATALLILWFVWDIPDPQDVVENTSRRPSLTLTTADGKEILRAGDVQGRPVELANLPAYIPRAVLATEDRRFYHHPGVDILGLFRALWTNLKAGAIRQGGSSLTQQLAKNLFLTREKTVRRKVQELFLAFWLEYRFSKDQILTLYLNRIYLGAGVYGLSAAAEKYFAKPASELTLYEAAVIAGLPKAPSRYNPIASPRRAAIRANQVLDKMVAAGWLEPEASARLKRKEVRVSGEAALGPNRRYFSDWIRGQLNGFLGHIDQDIIIRTTLNLQHQKIAEFHAADLRSKLQARQANALAFLAIKPDGAITAMMGGYSWSESPFNRVTQAFRQPGSAFKPFVFLAGLEAGMTPDSRVDDRKITVEGWSPKNASGDHLGAMTLREGAARSSNSVAVAVSEKVGRSQVLQVARRLGISSELRAEPAIALGVFETSLLDMTGAYAHFANGGYGVTPYGIIDVRTAGGRLLYQRETISAERMIDASVLADLNNLLAAVIGWGTGKKAQIDRPVAGKTGTSQEYRDAWFIGYSRDLVAGVWMGNDDARPTNKVTGGSYPALFWRAFMRDTHRGKPIRPLAVSGR